ncbi:ABC transporter permease [Iodidimonas nitroreducens]|uniref:ABC transporter permease n=1 Tax=Iodidimonas nitroreducens TaxID=1236968 RepID=A0A5A7N9U2_9PROT|nr:HlyD family efflux transporter periplasmic adaptor subunit [Iodidimonas nitroreducens]GAK34149.1 putative macrolide-specific efflux protein MacA [alpha proteobacterium Q-1]GER05141.1 ABC transporter permease [Iodidimonas nitroreducens]
MDRKIERRFPKWLKPAAAGLFGLIVIILAAMMLMPEAGRALRLDAGRVSISTVSRGVFEDFIPVRGRVTPLRTLFLDSIEGGRVEEIFVEDGATVKAGDLLVRLSNTSLQLDVISREAEVTEQLNNLNTLALQLEQNRLDHKRSLVEIDYQIIRLTRLANRRQDLSANGHVSLQDLEATEDELSYWKRRHDVTIEAQTTDERLQKAQMVQLENSVAQLKTNLAFARRNLDNLDVKAPIAGKLTAFTAEIGQSLARGERLGQIDSPEDFKLSALIDEFYLPRVDIGQSASVEIDGRTYLLSIAKIYPQVRDGQFEIDLVFSGNMPSDIRRGQTLQTRLSLGDPTEAVLIPNGAFYQDTGGNWLFVMTPDSTQAIKRSVRLGRRNARFIEVLEGLEPGERVVTSPYTGFTDMDRLEFDQ